LLYIWFSQCFFLFPFWTFFFFCVFFFFFFFFEFKDIYSSVVTTMYMDYYFLTVCLPFLPLPLSNFNRSLLYTVVASPSYLPCTLFVLSLLPLISPLFVFSFQYLAVISNLVQPSISLPVRPFSLSPIVPPLCARRMNSPPFHFFASPSTILPSSSLYLLPPFATSSSLCT